MLEYASQVWSPSKITDIELLESVQRYFTRRLPGMRTLSYSDRLRTLGLKSLEERRLYLDLVFCYTCLNDLNGITPADIGLVVSQLPTRGHDFKLTTFHSEITVRSNFFANRVVKVWNSLPSSVIASRLPVLTLSNVR